MLQLLIPVERDQHTSTLTHGDPRDQQDTRHTLAPYISIMTDQVSRH